MRRKYIGYRLLFMTFLGFLALLPAETAKVSPAHIAIVGGTVVHPERNGPATLERDMTIILSGQRIQTIGPAKTTPLPKDALVIQAGGKWIIPGLIDSHVHFFQSGNLYTRPDAVDLNKWVPYAKERARNTARLPATFKVWLASGVTGVADVGGPFWNFDVREAARRSAAAPRLVVAGPLISMVARPQMALDDPPIIKIDTPDAARALVKRQLERQTDYVKAWFIHRKGDDLAAQEAIVKAAGDTAHAAGVRLAVHATELLVAKAALRAGADLLVHSITDQAIDDEFIELVKKNRALYTPTLFVSMGYALALSDSWKPTEAELRLGDPQILQAMNDLKKIPADELPERIKQLMSRKVAPKPSSAAMSNLRKVWDAGITVVMGTDAGNIGTVHGPSVFREMELMVQAGLTPQQVLLSATGNGARTLGLQADLGVLAPGKLADLVILDADPLANIANLSRIHRVIKDGALFDPVQLIESIR
ncbi:MAG: amidohydrolase family protein [Acidobacteria bacterium]|nr:amidohydrolase family protein [Acidobacteriota bacterium]MBI3658411.1 amidohydrolase family protein [Acidobacteriota bacterium]